MEIADIEQSDALFICPECGLKYREKAWAERCAQWCKKHKSCNLEIIKHAAE